LERSPGLLDTARDRLSNALYLVKRGNEQNPLKDSKVFCAKNSQVSDSRVSSFLEQSVGMDIGEIPAMTLNIWVGKGTGVPGREIIVVGASAGGMEEKWKFLASPTGFEPVLPP
jgi:hypothetical protein